MSFLCMKLTDVYSIGIVYLVGTGFLMIAQWDGMGQDGDR